MKEQGREEPKIVSAAEKQMQAWAHSSELAQRRDQTEKSQPKMPRIGPFLTVSREKGAEGGQIAEMVAHKLGWEVLGHTLLDRIAERYRLSRPMLEVVDETKANWAHDILGTWIDQRVISHEKYITHLRYVVLAAAHCGRVVFLGRGAQFFLPAKQGLAVRIVAPEEYRIERVTRQRNVDAKEARRIIKKADEGRRDFVARYFRRDIADPHLYDLVMNVANHGPRAVADVIVELCSKFETKNG